MITDCTLHILMTRDLATQFIVGYDIPCMLYEPNFRLYT